MYQASYYDKNNNIVHIWDDDKGYIKHIHKPYGYIKDPKGKFKYLYGFNVKKTYDITTKPYEYDVHPETRTLIDLYQDSDAISKNIRILKFDIETAKDSIHGYSPPNEALNSINSIAWKTNNNKKYNCLILGESQTIQNTDRANVIICKSEKELLARFLKVFKEFQPHIIVGWNSDYFDIPYLCNRIIKILGENYLSYLSPIGIVNKDTYGGFEIAGVTSIDYMEIYKKFTPNEKTSYSLDAIAKEELNKGKIEYVGDLWHLYKTDFNTFIEYNIVDVELIVLLDEKLKLIDLIRSICHKGHVSYSKIHSSSVYIEGAILTYMKRNNLVAPNKPKAIKLEISGNHAQGLKTLRVSKISNRTPFKGFLKIQKSKSSFITVEYLYYRDNVFYLAEPLPETVYPKYTLKLGLPGAFVKDPIIGLHKWVFDEDLTSLYPSIMRTLNLSPETKKGRVLNWDAEEYYKNKNKKYDVDLKGKIERLSYEQLTEYFKKWKCSIASNGVMFTQKKPGFIPTILTTWFDERVENNNLKKKYGKLGDKEKSLSYHQIQLTLKTMLNTVYGVLALPTFRFSDIDNAAAITSTGVSTIKFSANCANKCFKKLLNNTENKEYVIYVDTDSIFCSTIPLLEKFHPNIDLYYKVEIDEELKQFHENNEFIKEETEWNHNSTYNSWFWRFISCAKQIKLLSGDVTISDGKIKDYTQEIPLYKFQVYLKSNYSPLSAAKELQVIQQVIHYAGIVQKSINLDYDNFAKYLLMVNGKHYLNIKQEYVAKDAIWITKKRYAQWVVDNEGIPVNQLDVKGLDVVRSNFPKSFRDFMKQMLIDILERKDCKTITNNLIEFKESLSKRDILTIMSSSSVKNITKYETAKKGIPAQIGASLNYNYLLGLLGDKKTSKIINGDKIKWVYLKKNKFNFNTMALKGFDDNEAILDFVNKNVDFDKVFDSNLTNKIQDFYNSLNWGVPKLNKNTNKFFK